jgi:DNA-binding NtrC family response regulator
MPRILIIDDDHQFRLMLRRLLEKEDYEILEATDGNMGIDVYRHFPCDVVITDIIMPEKEGVETIVSLRKEYPDLKIIAISGGGRNAPCDYLMLAEKLGAQAIMEKPLDRTRLLAILEKMISDQSV